MFQDDSDMTSFRIQIARLVATILMVIAVNLICSPIPALAEFIPFLNSIVANVMLLFSLIVGVMIATLTIAVAHITQDPVYLLAACISLSLFFYVGASSDSEPDDAVYSYHMAYFFAGSCLVPVGYIVYNFLNKGRFEKKLAQKLHQLHGKIPLAVVSAPPVAMAVIEMPTAAEETSEKQKLLGSRDDIRDGYM